MRMTFSLRSIAVGLAAFSSVVVLSGCAATSGGGSGDSSGGRKGNPIVNGQETSDYPEAGVLLMQGQAFCTGTLVAPRSVITAGHCVDGQDPTQFTFGIGATQDQLDSQISVVAGVAHPQFDMQQLVNDVAVITLGEDAPIAPMPMNPSMDQSWIGKQVTLVGFGVDDGPSQSNAGIKRKVDVTIDQVDPQTLHYTTQQGQTACNGDSGGPAFADQGGQLVVAGITSYGDQNCQQFGVYTRVDAYLDFINEQIQAGGGQGGSGQGGSGQGGSGQGGNGQGGSGASDPGAGASDPGAGGGGSGAGGNDPGADNCMGVTYEGECDGNTVLWCENGELMWQDCLQCGFDQQAGYYDCVQ
jgi:hypothetical protein